MSIRILEIYKSNKNSMINNFQNLKKFTTDLPGYHWWKSENGEYLGANDRLVEFGNFSSLSDLVEKTDFDLPWVNTPEFFTANDQHVMNSNITQLFLEPSTDPLGNVWNMLAIKTPLISEEGKIAGMIGSSLCIDKAVNEVLQDFLTISEKISFTVQPNFLIRIISQVMQFSRYQEQDQCRKEIFDYGVVKYTLREAQCLHFFLNSYSSRETADKLFISPKTVEFHIASIKKKLNCHNRSQITRKAMELGFIDLMFIKF